MPSIIVFFVKGILKLPEKHNYPKLFSLSSLGYLRTERCLEILNLGLESAYARTAIRK